jgi:ribosomal protein S18 acetylase RimI-like enzyme
MTTTSCPLGKVSTVSEQPLQLVDGRVFRIRPARQDDLDRLLWAGEHLRANRQHFLDRQARGEALVLLPTLDDEPIGHLAVDLVGLRDEGGVYLYWFEIREEFTGKGIGTAVINRAEQIAGEAGRSFSEIAVEKTNMVACRLYERLGYSRVGDRLLSWLADLPDGGQVEVAEDCWVLRKFLGARAPSDEKRSAGGS